MGGGGGDWGIKTAEAPVRQQSLCLPRAPAGACTRDTNLHFAPTRGLFLLVRTPSIPASGNTTTAALLRLLATVLFLPSGLLSLCPSNCGTPPRFFYTGGIRRRALRCNPSRPLQGGHSF